MIGDIHRNSAVADGVFRSANLHLVSACNYRCGFCFSKNLCNGIMGVDGWSPILRRLRDAGVRKVNMAGGEPFLYPYLVPLCRVCRDMGFMVGIVSNGSLIDGDVLEELKGNVDWLGLSVDSVREDVEERVGRGTGDSSHINRVVAAADAAHSVGMSVKLNITVVSESVSDDFRPLIKRIDPQRVKVLQVLELGNVNSDGFGRYAVSDDAFRSFRDKHIDVRLSNGEAIVFEDNDTMENSYLMLDPLGRVMTNRGRVLEIRDTSSFLDSEMDGLDYRKYVDRDGLYFMNG